MDKRLQQLTTWISDQTGTAPQQIEPASEDASFRRYFRMTQADGSTTILVDAPPEKEDPQPFVTIAKVLREIGLNAPEVFAADLEQGFLWLSDLGTTSYLDALNTSDLEKADALYKDAIRALIQLQTHWPKKHDPEYTPQHELPRYDVTLLLAEMNLFRDWYLRQHCGLKLEDKRNRIFCHTFSLLADNALKQPRVTVHRDYHSRNLMAIKENNPGILDFQDAVRGPITYDLVSLLRDCYIAWPAEQIETWLLWTYQQMQTAGQLEEVPFEQFQRWFDWMGMQRHLKAIGIFARLHHRDDKSNYLNDIPRTMNYLVEISAKYPELAHFHQFLRALQAEQSEQAKSSS